MFNYISLMSRKQLIIIWITGTSLLGGCARIQHQENLKTNSFYITVQRGYPPVKAVTFFNKDMDYKPLDKRIEEYLNSHPTTKDEIAKSMKHYVISVGMNKGEILTIAGKDPDSKEHNKQNEEVWVYGSILMQGRTVIITFKDDYVVRIDDKYWDSCPQCG